ncbi:YgaP family membrane protein [Cnuella takakiae]|uniref:YgaP family membrane protein n=1 Tax=Cnuella takakiae TaxID=1302690 RepID=UPI00373FDED2
MLAGIFILTSFVGFCLLYTLLGMNTCPDEAINQEYDDNKFNSPFTDFTDSGVLRFQCTKNGHFRNSI